MHLCNAFFEWELESAETKTLSEWMNCHKIIRKLQYLPLQYAGRDDRVLVLDFPVNPDPRCHLLSDPPIEPLESWGASRAIALWAAEHKIPYTMPPWEVVREVNSKTFSFQQAPLLPGSALLKGFSEVSDWMRETPGELVLKTPQGVAGRGHFFLRRNGNLEAFLKQHPIVIGERWVQRTFDFSTQWKIGEGEIRYLGATILKNRADGTYLANEPWNESYEWALNLHLEIAKPLLQKIEKMGFFGNLGIDAFVYLSQGKETLHPIVEINARKTMGWISLHI